MAYLTGMNVTIQGRAGIHNEPQFTIVIQVVKMLHTYRDTNMLNADLIKFPSDPCISNYENFASKLQLFLQVLGSHVRNPYNLVLDKSGREITKAKNKKEVSGTACLQNVLFLLKTVFFFYFSTTIRVARAHFPQNV